MKQIKEIINHLRQSSEQLSTESFSTQNEQSTFSEHERLATGYLFMRLRAIYGNTFKIHFTSKNSVRQTKREWAKDIGKYTRDQIDSGLDYVKEQLKNGNQDYKWPDVGQVIGSIGCKAGNTHMSVAYIDIHDPKHPTNDPSSVEFKGITFYDEESKEKRRNAGELALDEIKGMW